eukprot:1113588-Rhodomonas_salina.1
MSPTFTATFTTSEKPPTSALPSHNTVTTPTPHAQRERERERERDGKRGCGQAVVGSLADVGGEDARGLVVDGAR